MKKSLLALVAVLMSVLAMAQAPQKMTYQAVVRDSNGQLVSNGNVGVRITIVRGSETGTGVYSQTETVRTNDNGLFTTMIGGTGFDAIDWGNGPYYLKSEVDPDGGSNYILTTTQQMVSVPYALHAGTVDSIIGGVNFTESDPIFSAWNKDYNDLINKPTIPTNVSELTNDAGYLTSFTETQVLSISNDTIYLTGGSYVKLPAGFSGDYNDLTNKPTIPTVPTDVSEFTNDAGYLTSFTEAQVLSIGHDTIYLTGGSFVKLPAGFSGDYNDLTNKPTIPTVPTDVSEFTNDAGYLTSFTEAQVLSISNDTIYLTGGSFVKLPAGFSGDYNDLTNKPTIPTVPTNVSEFTNDAGYLTSFTEVQVLSISNDTIYLTGGSYVKLPAGFSGNYNDLTNKPTIPTVPTNVSEFTNDAGYLTSFTEAQVLSIGHDTIYLTGGSYVKLPAGFSGDYNDLTNKPTIPTVPTNVSEFTNDAGYLTSFTEAQVLSIGHDTIYLTGGSYVKLPAGFSGNYNDLTNKPTIPTVPTNVSEFTNDAGYITSYSETDPVFTAWNKDYNDLTNKPTIPTVPTNVSEFTNDAGYLTSFTEAQVLSIGHDTIYLTGGSFVKLPAGFSGDYNDLTNKPTIPTVPTNVSEFTNDAGYLTSFSEAQVLSIGHDTIYLTGGSYVKLPAGFSGDYNDLTNKPTIPTVPTNVSEFTNDAGYLTSFTEAQVLSIGHDTIYLTGGSYVKLPAGFSGNYNDLTNKPTIPTVPTNVSEFTNDAGYITSYSETDPVFTAWNKDYNDLINKPTIPIVPTNVSDFTNDAGYLVANDLQSIQNNITALQTDSIQTLREEMGDLMDSIRVLRQSLNDLTTLVSSLNVHMEQEHFNATDGQTSFSLQHAPKPTCIIRCYVNGVMVGSNSSGLLEIDSENPQQINYSAIYNRNYSLKTDDKVTIVYWY